MTIPANAISSTAADGSRGTDPPCGAPGVAGSCSEGRTRTRKVLAVASGGGHWEQMLLLWPMLRMYDTRFATTVPGLAEASGVPSAGLLPDCNKTDVLAVGRCIARSVAMIARMRPDVVISTGAAPGLIIICIARLAGARAIWLDSMANVERLSLSGRMARHVASACVTQWEHLATDGVEYHGRLM